MFAAWKLIFRSVINLARYIFKGRLCDGTTLESKQITAEQYCNASKAIKASLTGSYLTTDGSLRQVNGDYAMYGTHMTKRTYGTNETHPPI